MVRKWCYLLAGLCFWWLLTWWACVLPHLPERSPVDLPRRLIVCFFLGYPIGYFLAGAFYLDQEQRRRP